MLLIIISDRNVTMPTIRLEIDDECGVWLSLGDTMDGDTPLITKRKLPDNPERGVAKKCRPCDDGQSVLLQPNLLNLSDDVLLFILKNLSHRDIKALSFCCRRLSRVCSDRSLWREVDLRSHRTNAKSFRYYLRYLNSYTTSLAVRGLEGRPVATDGEASKDDPDSANSQLRGPPVVDIVDMATGARINLPGIDDHFDVVPEHVEGDDPGRIVQVHHNHRGPVAEHRPINVHEILVHPNSPPRRRSYVMRVPLFNQENEAVYWSPSSRRMKVISCHAGFNINIDPQSSTETEGEAGSSNREAPTSAKPEQPQNCNSSPKPFSPSYDNAPSPSDEREKLIAARLEAEKVEKSLLTKDVVKLLTFRCPNLVTLKLEYCFIDCNEAKITNFPKSVETLSFKGTNCINLPANRSYLYKIEMVMPRLRILDLSWCEWLTSHSFMSLSKLPVLESLLLTGCPQLHEFVAYASLSAQYGFRTLKVLDMRSTGVAHAELSVLGSLKTLEELYLSAPTENPAKPDDSENPLADPLDDGCLKDWENNEPCAILQELEDEEELKKFRSEDAADKDKSADANSTERNGPPTTGQVFVVSIRQERVSIQQEAPPRDRPIEVQRFFEHYNYGARIGRPLQADSFVTDATVGRLGGALKVLECPGYKTITNRSLNHLAGHVPHLVRLDVSNTGVNAVGIAAFHSSRPDCQVIAQHLETSEQV